MGGKEIFNTFFVTIGERKHKCRSCNGIYAQDTKKGYTNLITHLQKEHPDYQESMKKNCETNPFYNKKGNNIFKWINWIIEDNLPFSFCEKETTKKYTNLEPISVDTLMKYIRLTTQKVEKIVADGLPNRFGVIIDGWKEGTTHYIAVYASYADSEGVSKQPLLAIAPPFDESRILLKIINPSLEMYWSFMGKVYKILFTWLPIMLL